jgi:hypothetical protein
VGEGVADGEGLGEGETEGEGDDAVADGDADTMMAGPFRSEQPATGSAHAMASATAREARVNPRPVVML